nr:transketolase C-terminal domain-containing protein [Bacillus pumilus]
MKAADAQPEALLLASGSEVGLAIEAQKALEKEGIRASVVSLPAWDRFDQQSDEYKESVLPTAVRARIAIEMGASLGWERYTGLDGDVIAIDKFGASAPGETIIEKYGFTVSNVVSRVKAKLNK